ncbi:DNA polymerase III subunit alpha [Candidatus Tremblaya phenacola]|uniref:DNA polymerase III subunit alpha n=1 Tax=Candidatus Tremblayella phenacoccinincola TaxID=1010676 RepID=A0A2G0V7B3_9PROT|nr:DNA polymerase III subunit alpha [Candidatus Tremblaya phenacola]PHN16361.1 DNA polymerase III subunit alpha [Candidatus Tremblaya phenacola]
MYKSTQRYVHLRMHSEYSVLDGTIRLNEALECAKANKQGALALTDLNNLFGVVKFYKLSRIQGIKPIVGCNISVKHGSSESKNKSNIILLATNVQGYRNLCKIVSMAWVNHSINSYSFLDEPNIVQREPSSIAIERTCLKGDLTRGLIALSGAIYGNIGQAIMDGDKHNARTLLNGWLSDFSGNFYVEIQRSGQQSEERYIDGAVELASIYRIPVVATHPIQFLKPTDFQMHEVRACIAENKILLNRQKAKKYTYEQYFKSKREMCSLFKDIPSALENTVHIAKRCNLSLNLGDIKLPVFPKPKGIPIKKLFVASVVIGLKCKIQKKRIRIKSTSFVHYLNRIVFEFEVILRMGFLGYFLIVSDFVCWAKNNGVPVGPGRGSGSGSLIAFILSITDVNPIQYGLLFERFLNPERIAMPDLDIDFCQAGRNRVISYVMELYGSRLVSQITTFGTFATRAAIRDIGRTLGIHHTITDNIAKLIPQPTEQQQKLNYNVLKLETIVLNPDRPEEASRSLVGSSVRRLISLAVRMDGLARNVAVHAGGVLIAPVSISMFCPLYSQEGDCAMLVSQFDKDDAETVGLVKFDFLGLTTLTALNNTAKHIKALHKLKAWSLEDICMEDIGSYKILQKADTIAIFQFESSGMKRILRTAKPDCFEDIIALIALFRPGPMHLMFSYCKRKHGMESSHYLNRRLVPILKETYGIIIYQEQVMQIARVIGRYTLAKADLLRRAISKKQPLAMEHHRLNFQKGARSIGLTNAESKVIFELMEKFACYGFNKSHATAYAILVIQTAWLKAHYPAEFIASNLSLSMHEVNRTIKLYKDSSNRNIMLLKPDVNKSFYQFKPIENVPIKACLKIDSIHKTKPKAIQYGLGAIKDTGKLAVQELIKAREAKPFTSLLDFCLRTNRRTLSKKTIELLIRAGAFDSSCCSIRRCVLIRLLVATIRYSERIKASVDISGLYPNSGSFEISLDRAMRKIRPIWSERRILFEEKKALGLYQTGHPFKLFKRDIRKLVPNSISYYRTGSIGSHVFLCGVVTSYFHKLINNKLVAVILLEDDEEQCSVYLNTSILPNDVKLDKLIIVRGHLLVPKDYDRINITAVRTYSLTSECLKQCRFVTTVCNIESTIAKASSFFIKTTYSSGKSIFIQIAHKLKTIVVLEHSLGLYCESTLRALNKVLNGCLKIKYIY